MCALRTCTPNNNMEWSGGVGVRGGSVGCTSRPCRWPPTRGRFRWVHGSPSWSWKFWQSQTTMPLLLELERLAAEGGGVRRVLCATDAIWARTHNVHTLCKRARLYGPGPMRRNARTHAENARKHIRDSGGTHTHTATHAASCLRRVSAEFSAKSSNSHTYTPTLSA